MQGSGNTKSKAKAEDKVSSKSKELLQRIRAIWAASENAKEPAAKSKIQVGPTAPNFIYLT
jgi:hypothetical protein